MKNCDNNKVIIAIKIGIISLAFGTIIDLIYFGVKTYWLSNQWFFLEPTPVVITVYGAFWAMYLLPTQSTFTQTSKKRSALNAAIRAGEKEKFLRYIDLQISWVTDLVFMVICGIILLMTFLIESELQEGLTIIAIVSSTMMFVRLMYLLRDNPLEGIYLFSPFWKCVRIGIWDLRHLSPDWKKEALTRNTNDCQ